MQGLVKGVVASILIAGGAFLPTGGQAQPEPKAGIRTLSLPPEAAYPEGVAVDATTGHIYLNSAVSGVLLRLDSDSEIASQVADPLKRTPEAMQQVGSYALGLKVDDKGRVWVAGGRSGTAHVVEVEGGQTLAQLTTAEGTGLLNDVILAGGYAYFTDTRRPMIWRTEIDSVQSGALEPWLDLTDSPIPYGEGANLNGIAASPDGSHLIVVHMGKGLLFRIDTRGRQITPITVEGGSLEGGDGLLLLDKRLFLVRQPAQEIVALSLSDDLTQATETHRINPPELKWPATLALRGTDLIVGNSQLNRRTSGDPHPFDLVVVPLSAFD